MWTAVAVSSTTRVYSPRRKLTMAACAPEASVSRRQTLALVGLAAVFQAQTAEAASGPKSSKPKKKSGATGSTGPSLTKSSEKLGEQSARESEFKERMAKIRAGGEPTFGGL